LIYYYYLHCWLKLYRLWVTGRTTKSSYHTVIEIRPYLTVEMCGPVDIVLTHPLNGHLKKQSLIQYTTELFVIESKLYGDVIVCNLHGRQIKYRGWYWIKIHARKIRRIATVHKPIQSQPPSSVKVKPEPLIEDKGMLRKTIKVADIAAESYKRKRNSSRLRRR